MPGLQYTRDTVLSIVIGFRDWGLERLIETLRSHSKKCPQAELVLVDYGSHDAEAVVAAANRFCAKYVRCEATLWSRSRALNAGIAVSKAPIVIFSDADILFASGVYLVWGGEDTDFFNRLRRAGLRPAWLTRSNERIYHLYHPAVRSIGDGVDYESVNRDIVKDDRSIYRNIGLGKRFNGTDMVSVVIATRNRAAYIGPCLESIANQTVLPKNIIVVDDGSDDDTETVVRRFRKVPTEYIKLPRVGLSNARNVGTAICDTKYVCVMDDDDLMMPSRVEDHLMALVQGFDFSYGGWINFDEVAKSVEYFPGTSE